MIRLKSWESPRRQGRNNKGKGGAARQRQLRKREQRLRNQLKENSPIPPPCDQSPIKQKEEPLLKGSSFFCSYF